MNGIPLFYQLCSFLYRLRLQYRMCTRIILKRAMRSGIFQLPDIPAVSCAFFILSPACVSSGHNPLLNYASIIFLVNAIENPDGRLAKHWKMRHAAGSFTKNQRHAGYF